MKYSETIITLILATVIGLTGFAANAPAQEISFALVADPQFDWWGPPDHPNNPSLDEECQAVQDVVDKIKEIDNNPNTPLEGCVVLGDLTWNRSFVYFNDGDYSSGCGMPPWSLECTDQFDKFRKFFEYRAKFGQHQGDIGIDTYIGLGNHDLSACWGHGVSDKCAEENLWKYVKDRFTGHETDKDMDPGSLPKISVRSFDDASGAYSWDWYDDQNGLRLHLVQLHVLGGGIPNKGIRDPEDPLFDPCYDGKREPDDPFYNPLYPEGGPCQGAPTSAKDGGHPTNLDWLEDDLDDLNRIRPGTPVIIFQHYNWNTGAWDQDPLHDVIRDSDANVIAAFHGHIHDYKIYEGGYWYEDENTGKCEWKTYGAGIPYYRGTLCNYWDGGRRVPIFDVGSARRWPPNKCPPYEDSSSQFSIAHVDLASRELTVKYYSLARSQSIVYTKSVSFNMYPGVNVSSAGNIYEGETFYGSGSFADPDDSTSWTATVYYGDGTEQDIGTVEPNKPFNFSHPYSESGRYVVTVEVIDNHGGEGRGGTTVIVSNVAPTVDAGAEQVVEKDAPFILNATFSDKGAQDTHEAVIDWDDGNVSSSMAEPLSGSLCMDSWAEKWMVDTQNQFSWNSVTVTEPSDGIPGEVSGGHTYSSVREYYDVTVIVGDDITDTPCSPFPFPFGLQFPAPEDVGTDTVRVVDNIPPTVSAGPDKTVNEGDTFSSSGSFSDPGVSISWSATVDYGDGTGWQALSFNPDKTFSLSHVYADNGAYTVTVEVIDNDAGVGTDQAIVTVNNAAPTVIVGADHTVDEGAVVSLNATFNDKGTLDTHTAEIDWGDGSPVENGTVTESPSGPPGSTAGTDGTVSGSHVYADNGVYTVEVTVIDDDGASTLDTLTVTVRNVAPTVEAAVDRTVNEGELISLGPATFNDKGTLDTHTATVDWGDGSPVENGTVTESPSGPPGSTAGTDGTVTPGSHVYADSGVYTVEVTVTDDDGDSGSDTLTVTVQNVAPTVEAGADQTVDEGATLSLTSAAFNDKGTLDTHTADIDWGDGSPVGNGVVTESPFGPPGSVDGADGTVSGSHEYGDNGEYVVTVMVTDDDGDSGSDTLTVTVSNVAPTVTIDSLTSPVEDCILPGQELSFAGSFTDPGWLDTHTSLWNFGDGSTDPGNLDEENAPPDATGTASAKHTYGKPGTFTVILTIGDDDGGIGTAKKDVKVMTASEAVDFVNSFIQDLPETCFDKQPEQRKNAFSEKLDAVKNAIAADGLEGAIKKLQNDIRPKLDSSVEGNPRNKVDWITCEESQKKLCEMIDQLVKYLESQQDKKEELEVAEDGAEDGKEKKQPEVTEDDGKGKDATEAAPALLRNFDFAVHTAYPQPCNPEVWIPYTLGEKTQVSISIHDINGRLVRILKLGYQNPGAYIARDRAAHWDGKDESGESVASGIYFYTMIAGDSSATRKIVVKR